MRVGNCAYRIQPIDYLNTFTTLIIARVSYLDQQQVFCDLMPRSQVVHQLWMSEGKTSSAMVTLDNLFGSIG